MKKSTKGGIAASAAVLLLLGGLGTHSTWTGNNSIVGSDLSTGGISLTSDCDTDKSWTFGVGATHDVITQATNVLHDNLAGLFLVPGDLLTKTCTFTVHVKGTHAAYATISVNSPKVRDTSGVLTDLVVTPTFTKGGTDVADGTTKLQDGDTFTGTIDVSLPSGSATGQDLTGTLDDITVTATQTS